MTDEEIARLLKRNAAHPETRILLDFCVGRILRRDAKRGTGPVHTEAEIRHVADWLDSARLTEAFWLGRTGPDGRPLKLAKLGSVAACVAEADKAMRLEGARSARTTLGPDDEAMEWDCGDGFALVRLLTSTALDLEGSRMGHCIGGGSYDARLKRSDHCFLSLRGPNGAPHATIELKRTFGKVSVSQAQGRSNKEPVLAHRERLVAFLLAYGIPVPAQVGKGLVVEDGTIRRAEGVEHLHQAAAEGAVRVSGDDAWNLPPGLRVLTDLVIVSSDIVALPPATAVGEVLAIEDCPRFAPTSLDELPLSQSVFLSRTGTTDFLDTGHVRSFEILGARSAEEARILRSVVVGQVPKNHLCKVTDAEKVDVRARRLGTLRIADCGGVDLPQTLSLDVLSIESTAVRTLPAGVSAHQIELLRTGISAIPRFGSPPKSLVVRFEPELRSLSGNLRRTKVSALRSAVERIDPDGGGIRSLRVEECPLVALPDGLTVRGDLVLLDLPMERLPQGLVVKGDLSISRLPIRSLPDDLRVEGTLRIQGCPLSSPFRIGPGIVGGVEVNGCDLVGLASGNVYRSDLRLCDNPIRALPDGIAVPGWLDLRNTGVDRLPDGATIGGTTLFHPVLPGLPDREVGPLGFTEATLGPSRSTFSKLATRMGEALSRRLVPTRRSETFRGRPENGRACRGIVVDSNGLVHREHAMNGNVRIEGDLELSDGNVRLPREMTVSGSLRLFVEPSTFPSRTRVAGDFVVHAHQPTNRKFWMDFHGDPRDDAELDVDGDAIFKKRALLPRLVAMRVGGSMVVPHADPGRFALPFDLAVAGDLTVPFAVLRGHAGTVDVAGDLVLTGRIDGPVPDGVRVGGRTRRPTRTPARIASDGWSFLADGARTGLVSLKRTMSFRRGDAGAPNLIERLRPRDRDVG